MYIEIEHTVKVGRTKVSEFLFQRYLEISSKVF